MDDVTNASDPTKFASMGNLESPSGRRHARLGFNIPGTLQPNCGCLKLRNVNGNLHRLARAA